MLWRERRQLLAQQGELIKQQTDLIAAQAKVLDRMALELSEHTRSLDVLSRATLRDVLADVRSTIQDRQYSMLETMDAVARGSSLARWGDGEIRLMLQPEFQLSGSSQLGL